MLDPSGGHCEESTGGGGGGSSVDGRVHSAQSRDLSGVPGTPVGVRVEDVLWATKSLLCHCETQVRLCLFCGEDLV